jgi:tetratricopeptide (TPR) repeat protein
MSHIDRRGCEISGATPAALEAYEGALAAFQSWRSGAETWLALALQEAPNFVMAHVLQAYLVLSSRDPRRIQAARPRLARALELPSNTYERLHLAAIAAVLADDYERAKAQFSELLCIRPRDVLALQIAHALDHTTSNAARMRGRIEAVLPCWSNEAPGYHAVLAMLAFSLEECLDYDRAQEMACAALALNPQDARAHHVMAHVFEMTARPDAGIRWMNRHVASWGGDTLVASHGWWHVALFHLAQGEIDTALAIYDRRIRADRSDDVAELIDAAALLWRIQLLGGDVAQRWLELSTAWAPHIGDRFCSFNDIHAMLAFVGARDWGRANRLEQALVKAQQSPTRYGIATSEIGLPACRGLIAFGRGNYRHAADQFIDFPARAQTLGGSRAQRDVVQLTLEHAMARLGQVAYPLQIAPLALNF